ncbi:MAG: hypothetical protein J6X92_02825 [Bacteroidales bacterium]|nr:hypothetical protein [Bacteroidales bacterium]
MDYKEELVPGHFGYVEYADGSLSRVVYHEERTLEQIRDMFQRDISTGVMEEEMKVTNGNSFRMKSKGGNTVTFYTKKVGELTPREIDAIVDIIVRYDSVDKRLKEYISKNYYNENLF